MKNTILDFIWNALWQKDVDGDRIPTYLGAIALLATWAGLLLFLPWLVFTWGRTSEQEWVTHVACTGKDETHHVYRTSLTYVNDRCLEIDCGDRITYLGQRCPKVEQHYVK